MFVFYHMSYPFDFTLRKYIMYDYNVFLYFYQFYVFLNNGNLVIAERLEGILD
jgi:hypothetical protein